ncbi:MAG: alpha/beta hydrolase [Oscillospiraceae bacterium]|nr:alpha/beta hydrolase [Oscillospiraceae bacterium]
MKTWKAALIGAATVAGAAAVSCAVTRFLVSAAIDREEPALFHRVTEHAPGLDFNNEFLTAWRGAGDAFAALPHETVTLTAQDGTPLVGHFYPCEGAKRVIVAMHGWRGRWSNFGLFSDFLFRNGCALLCAEQRGQSASGGDCIGFGLTERFDCADWAYWAAQRCGADVPIYLFGVSMGASTVLMATGLELPKNVCGVMADCGFTSPAAEWKHVMENNLHLPYSLHRTLADAMFRARNRMRLDQYSTVDALAVTDIPVFFAHGAADRLVPVWMTYENYTACAAPKRLLIVPGANHGESYYLEQEKYEKELAAFWAEFD